MFLTTHCKVCCDKYLLKYLPGDTRKMYYSDNETVTKFVEENKNKLLKQIKITTGLNAYSYLCKTTYTLNSDNLELFLKVGTIGELVLAIKKLKNNNIVSENTVLHFIDYSVNVNEFVKMNSFETLLETDYFTGAEAEYYRKRM